MAVMQQLDLMAFINLHNRIITSYKKAVEAWEYITYHRKDFSLDGKTIIQHPQDVIELEGQLYRFAEDVFRRNQALTDLKEFILPFIKIPSLKKHPEFRFLTVVHFGTYVNNPYLGKSTKIWDEFVAQIDMFKKEIKKKVDMVEHARRELVKKHFTTLLDCCMPIKHLHYLKECVLERPKEINQLFATIFGSRENFTIKSKQNTYRVRAVFFPSNEIYEEDTLKIFGRDHFRNLLLEFGVIHQWYSHHETLDLEIMNKITRFKEQYILRLKDAITYVIDSDERILNYFFGSSHNISLQVDVLPLEGKEDGTRYDIAGMVKYKHFARLTEPHIFLSMVAYTQTNEHLAKTIIHELTHWYDKDHLLSKMKYEDDLEVIELLRAEGFPTAVELIHGHVRDIPSVYAIPAPDDMSLQAFLAELTNRTYSIAQAMCAVYLLAQISQKRIHDLTQESLEQLFVEHKTDSALLRALKKIKHMKTDVFIRKYFDACTFSQSKPIPLIQRAYDLGYIGKK